MAKRKITVELEDETIEALSIVGEPSDVLIMLALTAAERLVGSRLPHRDHTDESLRVERVNADAAVAKKIEAVEETADAVVQVARDRADQVVQIAREEADRTRPTDSTAAEAHIDRSRAGEDRILEGERSTADAVLQTERGQRRRYQGEFLQNERRSTDQNLHGERAQTDASLVELREANEKMVLTTIGAHELAAEAEAARLQSEEKERDLRVIAEFREMFMGMLGHDLRNPLGSIVMSAAGMLRFGRLNDQDSKAVSRILRASDRMTRMIAQLLDLTRVRLGGGLPLEVKPADLGEICDRVREEFEAKIELDLDGDLSGTWDEDRLAEVISNLVGNAVEYAAPRTPVVITARGDTKEVVVEIKNQGAPIPADVLPFIFDPFRRANQREKSRAGNLGLGLYIAKQIVSAHGGTLEARSADGTTTFEMRLARHASPTG
jgi:signal transduction histidine kinase